MIELFAEVGIDPLLPWANLTATASMTGLLIWLITKFLPKIIADNQTHLTKEREANQNHLTQERTAFTVELRSINSDAKDEADKFITALDKQRTDFKLELSEFRKANVDERKSQR